MRCKLGFLGQSIFHKDAKSGKDWKITSLRYYRIVSISFFYFTSQAFQIYSPSAREKLFWIA